MVVKRQCSFCASEIEPGTGWTFVKRDGTVFHFCSSSCRKQQLHLGRVGHRFKWTRAHALRVAAEHSTTRKAVPASAAPARARRRPAARPAAVPPAERAPAETSAAPAEAAPVEEPSPSEVPAKAPAKPRARSRKKPARAGSAKD